MGAPAEVFSHVRTAAAAAAAAVVVVVVVADAQPVRPILHISPHTQIVGDRIASPPDHASLFTERVMMHPLSFFAPASYSAHHSSSAAFQQFISSCGGAVGGERQAAQVFDFGERNTLS